MKMAWIRFEIAMETALKIDFHGAEPSEALQNSIVEHVAALERFFGRLTACHVALRAPGGHHRTGGQYEVDIHLTLPDGREVNVGRTPRQDERHSNVLFAVNDAFRRVRRQLQDHVRRLQAQVKTHESPPSGTVTRFDRKGGFGFIKTADGHEIYFHKNSVIEGIPSKIAPGTRVTFVEEMGEKGPQASTVRLLGKHGMR
jgi:cold shock CspA family protein/ribosome-associated translation inhibitor RaiA